MSVVERMRRSLRVRADGGGDLDDCRQAARLVQSYLDGEVRPQARARIAQHLEVCRRCGLEARTYAEIKAALAGWGGPVDELALLRLRQFGASLVRFEPHPEPGR